MRASLLYRDARYVDSLVSQPGVLGGAKWRCQPAARIYERVCATTARILERNHLYDDELEGVQDAVGGCHVGFQKRLVTSRVDILAIRFYKAGTPQEF